MYITEKPPRAIAGIATGFALSAVLWVVIGAVVAVVA